MSNLLASLTVDQLRDRFQVEESPYWWVYSASRSKQLLAKYRPTSEGEDEQSALNDSWTQLEYFFLTHPGGIGRVVLKRNPTDNITNSPQLNVKWGTADKGVTNPTIGSTQSPQSIEMNYIDRILKMQEQHFEQRISDKDRFVELLLENQNLNAAVEGMQAPDTGKEMMKAGMEMLTGILAPRPPATLGTAGEAPAAPPPPAPGTDDAARPFSTDQMLADVGVIRRAIPDIHPNNIIRALALFANQNPDQARSYLNMLITQVQ